MPLNTKQMELLLNLENLKKDLANLANYYGLEITEIDPEVWEIRVIREST